jgi:CheY-like chemotaxis protein
MRVLLIDDEPAVRKVVRKMLARAGHHVGEAENGRDGLNQLERTAFDLVVTDIIMPEMEGIETLMAVRERFPYSRGRRHVGQRSFRPCQFPRGGTEAWRFSHPTEAVHI